MKSIEKYESVIKADAATINKYRGIVPDELLAVWEEYGFGYMLNGYLRVINPDDYKALVRETYFRGDISIPIFTTAFGDVINWEEGRYIRMVKYKNGTFHGMAAGFKFFFPDLEDEEFVKEFLEIEQYEAALQLLPMPKLDECYGYTPLLALGGSEKVENLRVVKIKEHIHLISQVIGMVGAD